MSALHVFNQIEKLTAEQEEHVKYFEFDEIVADERLRAFTHTSSFVGNVRYDSEQQGMRIILNGIEYSFCNVPERIFDAFQGANSKGAFFARNIKGQFDC